MSGQQTAEGSAVGGSAGTKKAQRQRGYVTLFGTWCKGCGLCYSFCPQGVLEPNGNGRPRVVNPEKCTACHWCDMHCPDMAITVQRLEPEEAEAMEAEGGQRGPVEGGAR
jgi:2-oxoglutarate ferredoxin oxidoreductase subunit delta